MSNSKGGKNANALGEINFNDTRTHFAGKGFPCCYK